VELYEVAESHVEIFIIGYDRMRRGRKH